MDRVLLKDVYKRGFNIYALLNKINRTVDIPDEVLERVCLCYLRNEPKVNNQWAWFITSLRTESRKYWGEQSALKGTEWKRTVPAMQVKELLKGIGDI